VGFDTAEFFSAEFYFKNNAAATVGEITTPMPPGDYSLLNRPEKRIYVEISLQPGQIFFAGDLAIIWGGLTGYPDDMNSAERLPKPSRLLSI
jgi:hypothetical protein